MQVRVAYEEFLHAKHTLSKATQRGYRIRLAAFVAWCEEQGVELEALTARHIRTFIDAVSRRKGITGDPVQSSTVRLYALTVKVFLTWCMREEDEDFLIAPKVVTRIQLPKADQTIIETFTVAQLEAMLHATERQPFPVRDKAIVSVLIDTGIRASELCELTLSNIWLDSDDSYIKVLGKGRKEREIALGRTARLALRRYLTRYRRTPKNKADQHVFLNRNGRPITVSGLEQIIEQVALLARIKDVRSSPHTFRHTYAVQYLLSENGDIYKLSRLLGHSSVKITERYLSSVRSRQVRGEKSILDQLKSSQ